MSRVQDCHLCCHSLRYETYDLRAGAGVSNVWEVLRTQGPGGVSDRSWSICAGAES